MSVEQLLNRRNQKREQLERERASGVPAVPQPDWPVFAPGVFAKIADAATTALNETAKEMDARGQSFARSMHEGNLGVAQKESREALCGIVQTLMLMAAVADPEAALTTAVYAGIFIGIRAGQYASGTWELPANVTEDVAAETTAA